MTVSGTAIRRDQFDFYFVEFSVLSRRLAGVYEMLY